MPDTFRLTMAQLNPIVGDISGNRAKALDAWRAGKEAGSDFVAMPEMFLAGYQPQDLVLKPAFTADAMAQAAALAVDCADGPPLGIGLPWAEDGNLYNVYAILSGGQDHRHRAQAPPAPLQRLRRAPAVHALARSPAPSPSTRCAWARRSARTPGTTT